MNFGVLFNVAVSVLAVMVLFTLVTSAINEFIADNLRNLRGQKLEEAIRKLLSKPRGTPSGTRTISVEDFFQRPEIKALMEDDTWLGRIFKGRHRATGGMRLPSAIEPRRYALAVLDMLGERERLQEKTREELREYRELVAAGVAGVGAAVGAGETGAASAERVQAVFDVIDVRLGAFKSSLDREVERLEAEYAEIMARASGWYLRSARVMLFGIGLMLAVGANVDLLRYADRLMTEANLQERAATAELLVAQVRDDDPRQEAIQAEFARLVDGLGRLDVRVGWDCLPAGAAERTIPGTAWLCEAGSGGTTWPALGAGTGGYPWPSPSKVIGWLLIGFGVTLGAQFWFDLFRKLVDLRTAGRTASPPPVLPPEPQGG